MPFILALLRSSRFYSARVEVKRAFLDFPFSDFLARALSRDHIFLCIPVGEWPRRTPIHVRNGGDGGRKCRPGGGRDGVHHHFRQSYQQEREREHHHPHAQEQSSYRGNGGACGTYGAYRKFPAMYCRRACIKIPFSLPSTCILKLKRDRTKPPSGEPRSA